LGTRQKRYPVRRRRRMSTEQDSLVRVENNFEEFPFFQPRKLLRQGSHTYKRMIEGENGTRLDQKWTVISSSESTLPGAFDQDVFIAVLEVLERRGGMPSSGTMEFSLYELAEVLGFKKLGGRTYEDLKESLERIAMTSVRSENAFWVEGQKRHITDTFRLWDVTLDESQNRKGERRSRHRIDFGRIFMRSFHDHYLRGLDTDLYRALASPVGKRLYRIIDHKRDGSGVWEVNLTELQQQIPIGPYKYPAKIREKLSKPHTDLIDAGFLASAAYPDREKVIYKVAKEFMRVREDLALAGTNEERIAIKLLRELSVRGDVARDLVAKHGPAHCTRYANALPAQKNLRNPAGWLRKAIEDDYELDTYSITPTLELPTLETEVLVENASQEQKRAHAAPTADPQAQELWVEILKDIKQETNNPSLEGWFEGAIPTDLDHETLTLAVPNAVAKEYITTRFKSIIESSLRNRLSKQAALHLAVAQ
jgi:hypothetical protein